MGEMHAYKRELSLFDLKEILEKQFPQCANQPIQLVESAGTVNTIYRLGKQSDITKIHILN